MNVLLFSNGPTIIEKVNSSLGPTQYEVVVSGNLEEVESRVDQGDFAAVLVDMKHTEAREFLMLHSQRVAYARALVMLLLQGNHQSDQHGDIGFAFSINRKTCYIHLPFNPMELPLFLNRYISAAWKRVSGA